jgi:hypothetical protein
MPERQRAGRPGQRPAPARLLPNAQCR